MRPLAIQCSDEWSWRDRNSNRASGGDLDEVHFWCLERFSRIPIAGFTDSNR